MKRSHSIRAAIAATTFPSVFATVAVATLFTAFASSTASATSYALCFGGRDNSGNAIPLDTTLTAGVVAQKNWNNDAGGTVFTGEVDGLTDEAGNATPVNLTYTAQDSWNNDVDNRSGTNLATGNAIMMNGILKANGPRGTQETMTFTNVPEGQYDLYVYTDMNGDGVTANVADWDQLTTYYIIEWHQFNDKSTFIQATNTALNGTRDTGNYVKFSNLGTYGRGAIGVVVTRIAGADGSGVAGVQLVNIGPASAASAPVIKSLPDQTVAQGSTATFAVVYGGGGGPFTLQWSTNGTPIPGATNITFTTGQLHARDSGTQFSVKITNPTGSATGTATLTVTPYTTAPSVVSVGAVQNGATYQVGVAFNQFLDPTTANNTANYTLASGTVSSAVYDDSIGGVVLTVSGLTAGATNSVTVSNVKNASGIAIAAPQTVQFVLTTPIALTDMDVGSPALAGSLKQIGVDPYAGSPIYQQIGGGNDIWNTADNFNFAYTRVQGDFEAIVNIRSLTGENWSKAELMARQDDFVGGTVTPGAGDPQISNMATPADQNNTVQLQYRDRRDQASNNAGTAAATPTYPHTWLRLKRVADAITIYESPDAKTWAQLAQHFMTAGQWTNALNIGIAVTRHNDADTNGAVATWSGFSFPPVPLAFTTTLPANTPALLGRKVTLSVAATGNPLNYQWSKGGTDIPGAIGPTLSFNPIQASDAGSYSVRIFSTPGGTSLHSDTAVTVTPYPPIPSASAMLRQDGVVEVGVTFDEAINLATLVPANFTLSGGGVVSGLKVSTNSYLTYESAALQTTGLTPGGNYVLTVKNVSDTVGQTITSTNVNFTVGKLTWYETGTPITPGQVVPVGTNGFDILNGGRQEWGTYDEITMAYVVKTNDFDVRLRVEFAEPGSEWTRVGLQARNTLNLREPETDRTNTTSTVSAYAQTHVNPTQDLLDTGLWDPNDPVQIANGASNNGHEQNCRLGAGSTTSGWGSVGDPAHYPHAWLRLARSGAVLHGYRSDDGINWIDQGTVTLADQQNFMYVGPFLGVETGNIWPGGSFDVWDVPFNPTYDRLFLAQFRDFGDFVSSTIVPITLTFSHSGNAVTINWTAAGTLLESSSLGTGATWTAVPNAPNTPTGGTITVNASGSDMFFRLQQQ